MNFEQAKELSFLVEWKVAECFSGPQCWCRRIVPVDPILYTYTESSDYEEEYEIVGDAAIDQQTAEHIVKLHNERHERVKQSCRDVMKETMDSLIPLNHRSVTLTNDPTINDFRTIKRKEID
jgi:hypothetical protein